MPTLYKLAGMMTAPREVSIAGKSSVLVGLGGNNFPVK